MNGTAAAAYRIERVDDGTVEHYRAARLAMLLDAPRAFCSTYAGTAVQPPSWWLARVTSCPTWLAWDGDRPVGSVGAQALPPGAKEACLIGMWVASPARGTGLGERLLDTVAAYARAQGCQRLVLDVADDNAPARRLYERVGMRRTGRVQVADSPGGMTQIEYGIAL